MYIEFTHNGSEPCGLEKYLSCNIVHACVGRGFHPGFFTRTANITQIISVEATISGARAPSKTIALEYLRQSIILATLIWNKHNWYKNMASQALKINNAPIRAHTGSHTAHQNEGVQTA